MIVAPELVRVDRAEDGDDSAGRVILASLSA